MKLNVPAVKRSPVPQHNFTVSDKHLDEFLEPVAPNNPEVPGDFKGAKGLTRTQ